MLHVAADPLETRDPYYNKLHSNSHIHFSLGSNTWCVQVLRSPKEAFVAALQSWHERCEKCICLQGDYVEK